MHVIDHPRRYRTGTRVLFLKGRHKDGIQDERMVMRISHDEDQFNRALGELIVDGVETTVPLFHALLQEPDIHSGEYNIHWLEKWLETNLRG